MKNSTDHSLAVADLVERSLVAPEEVGRDIDKISRALGTLMQTRLKFSTLVTLIAEDSGIGKRSVEKVLKAAMALGSNHLNPPNKK